MSSCHLAALPNPHNILQTKSYDLKRNLDEKTKFYEKIKEEQILLKKRMDDFSKFDEGLQAVQETQATCGLILSKFQLVRSLIHVLKILKTH